MKPFKIVQVAAPVPAGGLERVVETLSVGLHRRGHDVTVVAFVGDAVGHPFVQSLASQGVRVIELRRTARQYLRERRELVEVCRETGPDVVHFHGHRTEIVNRGPVSRLSVATVTTVHGHNPVAGAKLAFYSRLQRLNYRRFDAVVAVSEPLRVATLEDGVPADRVHLVPNAWGGQHRPLSRGEARATLGLGDDAQVVGWVGRMSRVKGGDVFIDALSRLPRPRPIGVMIGYGEEAEQLRRQASDAGLADGLRFFAEIADAGRYFKAFDAYVLSSRSEGLPIVLLEAMAAHTPIVATRVGGVAHAITQEEGWLVPSEDAAALAQAVADCLAEPLEAAARAQRGAARLAGEYSVDVFVDRYEQVYRQAMARRT